MSTLTESIKNWKSAWESIDPDYKPLDQNQLDSIESQLDNSLPIAWKEFLMNGGHGLDVQFTWPGSWLGLKPSDAIEHQVETSDGVRIANSGKTVIGYIHGIGDSVIIDNNGPDPMVYLHDHSSGNNKELGQLSGFIDKLTNSLNSRTNLKISDAISHIIQVKAYSHEVKWGWNNRIRYNYEGKEELVEMRKTEFEILKRATGIDPVQYSSN